ncbi:hypothetical protein QWY90_07870 [Flavobacterium paronense]|uniref:Uncharacterized protein n=1 Tax=Flavobacterium paronense TaxID=1392775 RepID=A0ABV5GGU4_9FLAO|nr:hypothetical protein [Flavobacterium paronense]MDN3677229.1 hypothetical protein [Flavobacterium paronense]
MKNLLLVLMLLFGFTAFSQGLTLKKNTTEELKLEKGKIYQNDIQIPSYQVKKILASNLHSLNLYKQAKSKEALGGMLLGMGITASVVDLAIGLFSDVKYPTAITYAGLAVVAISIPILSGRAKKVEEALKTYNDGLKNTSSSTTNFDLNTVANQNGIGIQIKF